jgi:putative tricarboxylic transport membrane protein
MPPRPEVRRELWSAVGLAVLAVAYLAANRAYPLDSLATPGPGVFPLAVGALMLGAAAAQAAAAVRIRPPAAAAAAPPDRAEGRAGRQVLALTAVLVGYPLAASWAGFLTASFLMVLITSRLLGAPGWWRPTALALGVTAAAYAIFVVWLGVPLPSGPLP